MEGSYVLLREGKEGSGGQGKGRREGKGLSSPRKKFLAPPLTPRSTSTYTSPSIPRFGCLEAYVPMTDCTLFCFSFWLRVLD